MTEAKRRWFLLPFLIIACLCALPLAGCATGQTDGESSATPAGNSETFVYKDLQIEVTNVHEILQETVSDEMGDPWQYTVFRYHEGATATVLAADMYTSNVDGKDYPRWGVLTTSGEISGERLEIDENLPTFDITADTIGVYSLESSVYVLRFEQVE